MSEPRRLLWFSHGAASAVALKLSVDDYGSHVLPLYCDVSNDEEREDNDRFRGQVEAWAGAKVQFIRSRKFSCVDEVVEKRKYIAGIKGAPCTIELKKIPRFEFQRADDIHLFGFTADEGTPIAPAGSDTDRIGDFEAKNPDMLLEWILRDRGITKDDCFKILARAGIKKPLRYRQGFKNNNCRACCKATSLKYWVLTRRINPVEFAKRAAQSRKYGARMTRWKGVRIFLDEIPPDDQIPARFLTDDEDVKCGPECAPELFPQFAEYAQP